jgi:hypothetical protein
MNNDGNTEVHGNNNITNNNAGRDMFINSGGKENDIQRKKAKKKILILSASPINRPFLRTNEEIRQSIESIVRAKRRHLFDIQTQLSVGFREFQRALLEHEPQVVHFIGHGEKEGIVVESKFDDITELVSADVLSSLFEIFSPHVECVILNACYSEPQAKAISRHIDYVIGMRDEINDKASIEFSTSFYDALGAGQSIEFAFKLGCIAIQQRYPKTEKHKIPVLLKRFE